MFTGLVEGLGRIEQGRRTSVGPAVHASPGRAYPAVDPLKLGESVAVNGCCLTVIAADGSGIRGPGRPGDLGPHQPRRPEGRATG